MDEQLSLANLGCAGNSGSRFDSTMSLFLDSPFLQTNMSHALDHSTELCAYKYSCPMQCTFVGAMVWLQSYDLHCRARRSRLCLRFHSDLMSWSTTCESLAGIGEDAGWSITTHTCYTMW